MRPNKNLEEILARYNQQTIERIADRQPPSNRDYRPDARSYCKLPIRATWMVKRQNDWRVLTSICATSSWLGICYASQQYIAELAGITHQPVVSNSLKNLHEMKLIRLLLPKGKAYPGRFQRSNRMQVLFEENAPLPSNKEMMLEWGSRTRRWK